MVESNAHTYLYAHLARPTAVSDAHDRPTPASQLVSQHGHVASAAGHRAMTAGAKHGSPLASQHRPSRSAHAGLEASPSALSVHTCSVAHGCPQASSRGGRWRSASVSPIAVLLVLGAMVPSVRAQEATPHDGKFVAFACLIPLLVGLSGLLAGLTLGYMSLDPTVLEVLAKTGTPKQRAQAEAILPLRRNGHLLLVSLLMNMAFNETLPVVSDEVLGGGVQAIVVSTALIIVFAEIIPQSVCTRFGLLIGAKMVWPTRIIVAITYPISKPVSMLLEYILGPHSGVVYRRAELKELIAMHASGGSHGGDLQADTAVIVGHTLDLQIKKARDAMTPLADVYMLDADATKLDYPTLRKILEAGHSRIPVYELSPSKQRRIIGCLIVKQLVMIDPEDAIPLRSVPIHPLPVVSEKLPLLELLNRFQLGRSHMAVVAPVLLHEEPRKDRSSLLKSLFKRDSGEKDEVVAAETGERADGQRSPRTSISSAGLDHDQPIGIITLEDLIEELIGEEIYDETDSQGEGARALDVYLPPEALAAMAGQTPSPPVQAPVSKLTPPAITSRPSNLLSSAAAAFGLPRARSTPGRSRSVDPGTTTAFDARPSSALSAGPLVAEPEKLGTMTEKVDAGTDAATQTSVYVPNKLADAVLFERGRRQLVQQGVDPAALNVRLANVPPAPVSASMPSSPLPATHSHGGRLMSVVTPTPIAPSSRHKIFKTSSLATLPMRQQPGSQEPTRAPSPSFDSPPTVDIPDEIDLPPDTHTRF